MAKKTQKEEAVVTQEANTSETTTEAPAESTEATLSLVDIRNAVNIMDYACDQGTFKGWKMIGEVSTVRQKFVNFLNAVAANSDAANSEAQVEENSTEGGVPAVGETEENR